MRLESFLEASAARRPDATALVTAAARFTYGELERRCNRLAWTLLAGREGVERNYWALEDGKWVKKS